MGAGLVLRFEAGGGALAPAESAPFAVFGEHATALRVLNMPSTVSDSTE
jgi:hypothetical protein